MPETVVEAGQQDPTSPLLAQPSQQDRPTRRTTEEEPRDQERCSCEASRLCNRFEYALVQVRQGLERPSADEVHEIWRRGRMWDESNSQLDNRPYNMLKEYWRDRGAWDEESSWQLDNRALSSRSGANVRSGMSSGPNDLRNPSVMRSLLPRSNLVRH